MPSAYTAFALGGSWTPHQIIFSHRRSSQCSRQSLGRWVSQAGLQTSGGRSDFSTNYKSVEETFGTDAGRDLFFPGMDSEMAIKILGTPSEDLKDPADRYVAAERLKFYPSVKATRALIECIRSADPRDGNEKERSLEDKVARRKAIETLGRYEGEFEREEAIKTFRKCLSDPDHYTVEVAVWALGKMGIQDRKDVLEDIGNVLKHPDANKRVVIQTLTRLKYRSALDEIENHVGSQDKATVSAAIAAIAHLDGRNDMLMQLLDLLKSPELNVRRAAMEDIMLCEYYSAIPTIQETPNSFVYRSRTIRRLLDASVPKGELSWDKEMEEIVDRLIWDHPYDMDLLGIGNETSKSRGYERNVKRLFRNDALYAYLASQTLAEDHRGSTENLVGDRILSLFNERGYFDYFAAYHVFKTLGWLRHNGSYDTLLENLLTLPPRFFNHQVGAATALAEIGNACAIESMHKIAKQTKIWELKYACMLSAERLGDNGELRTSFVNDEDWLIRARARSSRGFDHLKSSFNDRETM